MSEQAKTSDPRPEALQGIESLQAIRKQTPASAAFSSLADHETLIQDAIKAVEAEAAPAPPSAPARKNGKAPAPAPAPEKALPAPAPSGDLASEALGAIGRPKGDEVPEEFVRNFDALSRREQAIREREGKVASDLRELDRLRKLEERLKAKDYKAAGELGLSIEDWAARELEGKPRTDTVVQELQKEIKELRDWRTKAEESERARAESEERNRAVSGFLHEFDTTIQAESFKPLRDYAAIYEATNGIPLDVHVACKDIGLAYWKKFQRDLTVQEIAETLNATAKARLSRLPQHDTLRNLFAANPPASGSIPAAPIAKAARTGHESGTPKTITGDLAAASSMDDEELDLLTGPAKIRAITARLSRT